MSDKSIAIKGGLWTSLSTAIIFISQIFRVVILTRFLEKTDFGLVSIVNTAIGLCLTFTDLGFASVIMYKQKLTESEFSTLFWLQFLLFSAIYIILCMVSPLIAIFYEQSILAYLIPLAGLSLIFQSFGKLYDSVLQKKYKFKLLAIRNIISNIVSLIFAWLLAKRGYGVYSLIWSTLLNIILYNLWNLTSGFRIQRISFSFHPNEVLPLLKIGMYQTGTHIFDFISNKLDVIIIGKLLGTDILGVYDLAKDLILKFMGFVRTVVSKVALPIMANNNDNDETVKVKFLGTTKVMAYLCIPICITVAVFSKEIVELLYGNKFADAAGLVSIFSILAIVTSISSFIDMLGILKGRTDLNFVNTIYRIVITTPIVLVTCLISVSAVAWGQLLTSFITFLVFWKVVLKKTYPLSFKTYFLSFAPYLMVVSFIGIIVSILKYSQIISIGEKIDMFLYVTIYLFLLVIGSFLFFKNEFAQMLRIR